MKSMLIFVLCTFCIPLFAENSAVDKDNDFYKLYNAAKKVKAGDSSGVRELMQLSLKKHHPQLSQAILKSMILGMLQAKSKALPNYLKKVSPQFLKFLEEAPLKVDCSKCEGHKVAEQKCRKCKKGECHNCRGKGTISYPGLNGQFIVRACATCNQSKKCVVCDGTQVEKIDCRSCRKTGKAFIKAEVPKEFQKALDNIMKLTPILAFKEGLYIGVGENKIAIAKAEKEAQEKRELARVAREEKEATNETARVEKEKKIKEEMAKNKKVVAIDLAAKRQKTLEHAILEFKNYLNAQEKTSKSALYEKAYGKFQSGTPTLFLELSSDLMGRTKGQRGQILEGFQKFWELRAKQNGLGSKAAVELSYQGKKVSI